MFSKLKELAAGAVKGVSEGFAKASAAIADLAASLATRAAAAADLGRILDIIEMVPGVRFDGQEADADYQLAAVCGADGRADAGRALPPAHRSGAYSNWNVNPELDGSQPASAHGRLGQVELGSLSLNVSCR